ncbi:MAG: class I SAM-dependent methyltransferase [Ignavibacteria bacterium]|nr:class I SAM-dependent methyltransferase [Ignavibacteria bacterium]
MNPILEEIFEKRTTKSVDGRTVKVNAQISRHEGELIRKCIELTGAEVSLEVGLAFGTSAMIICESLKKTERTRHYIMDPYQMYEASYGGIGLNNIRKSGFGDIIEFIDKPSQLALPELAQRNVTVDFAFIDGWHTFDHTLVDFFFTDKLLREGGIVILDDTDWPAISRLVSFIDSNRSYEYIAGTPPRTYKRNVSPLKQAVRSKLRNITDKRHCTLPRHGATAFRKMSEDHRNWDHFQGF